MNLNSKILGFLPYKYVNKRKTSYRYTKESSIEPNVYNQYGQRKRTFYLQDYTCRHSPYTFSSKDIGATLYINWDRFNKALPIHFYSHEEIFNCEFDSNYLNFGILIESEAINPKLYAKILNNKEKLSRFKGIFTHSKSILNSMENSFFIPGSSVWYTGYLSNNESDFQSSFLDKTKNISIVCSNKCQCDLHRFRMHLADILGKYKDVDVLGTYNGGSYIPISKSLDQYRYSIVIENYVDDFYFTEKILNCFASKTVPIYLGASRISDYFDKGGIIIINENMSDTEIINILKECSVDDYKNRANAIMHNFELVKEYECIEDYIYIKYKYLFDSSL